MARSIPVLTLLALMCCVPCLRTQTQTPTGGAVEGRVIDEGGNGIAGANVYALPAEDMRRRITASSGPDGAFLLTGLPAGDVYLHAYKESAGYPDDFFAFYATKKSGPIRVPVAAGKTTFGVRIQIGPPSAYLRLSITNDQGVPTAAGLVFARADMPGPYRRSVAANQSVTVMVPPVPFRLTIEADGYAPWHYGGDLWEGKPGLIDLESGKYLDLTVQLKRR